MFSLPVEELKIAKTKQNKTHLLGCKKQSRCCSSLCMRFYFFLLACMSVQCVNSQSKKSTCLPFLQIHSSMLKGN